MKNIIKTALIAIGFIAVNAQASLINLPDKPLYVGGGVRPMVMLDVTKDHQLHFKAYNDYTDLDNDGTIDRTYKHSISYYGYFDTYQCYSYNNSENVYKSTGYSADKYCSGAWSGNFLNWSTMTRMDVVRKILYGGLRSTDTTASTVLERNFLPSDAHAFAKYYGGADLGKLTPFPLSPTLAINVSSSSNNGVVASRNINTVTSGNVDVTLYFKTDLRNNLRIGDQIKVYASNTPTKYLQAPITSLSYSTNNGGFTTIVVKLNADGSVGGTLSTATSAWSIENLTTKEGGLSICNVTVQTGGGVNNFSHTNTNPPLMRVARGNFELWSANEKKQCQWFEDVSKTQTIGSNANNVGITKFNAATDNPYRNYHGLGNGFGVGEYIVRVSVCNPTYIVEGTDEKDLNKCKVYGSTWKPIGLLQNYTDNDLIRFGLLTGSYQKNLSGGVLRKNIGDMSDEIDLNTGIFKAKTFTTSVPNPGSIIKTIDRMRIYGFRYDQDSSYGDDGCSYQLTSINEGRCRTFGNPMSAIYYESIKYLAGKTQTAAYNYPNSNAADNILGLSKATWTDPLNSDNFCSPLNVLVFNSSVSGYDTNSTSGDLGATTLGAISSPVNNTSITSATNAIGDQEGLTGKKAFIGVGTESAINDIDYKLCSAKTIGALGQVNGICPEGPATQGTYHMAGIADYIKNNKIRNFSTVPSGDKSSLKVTSYAIQLASNTPEIQIPVNGKTVSLRPVYRLDLSSNGTGPFGSGAIVDFKISEINADGSAGSLYVNWEDSQQGGDFDQDVYGIIKWEVTSAGKLKITTNTSAASSNNGQGFGYTISGTSKDGPHFHSGTYNYDFVDPTNLIVYDSATNVVLNGNNGKINNSGGCRDCNLNDPTTYALYDAVGDSSQDLKDPLYYLAKYGGSKDKNNNQKPDLTVEWDSVINLTGANGSDGIPDNYFYAINPLLLESSLQQAFNAILVTSSSSSVATNSTFLRNNSLVYQAKYFTGDWSGQLTAFKLNNSGVITSTQWEADLLLNAVAPNSREIITYNETSKLGVPLRWITNPNTTSISPAIKTAFGKNAAGTTDTYGEKRLLWVRGNSTDEGSLLRNRPRTKLGDIIDSSPVFVSEPQSRVNDPTFDIYYKNNKNREPMLYVGANDGMLHAFNANTGVIKFSYMPGEVARGTLVSKTTNTQYGQSGTNGVNHAYGVNGNPTVADIKFGQPCDPSTSTCNSDSDWRTILVGSLANGGQGIFALDVTDPNSVKESTAASKVLWEFTDSDDTSLGYTFSQPQISRICTSRGTATTIPAKCLNSTPVAVFGGGYNPTSGTGSLFVVNLQTGALIKKINVTGGSSTSPNGLSSISLLDIDGDGVMEAVYAGDILGNMWKFDTTTSTTATVAFGNNPLYKAVVGSVVQPITSAPEILDHPKGGYLIMFGTGKYIEGADLGNMEQQSFYSIWDKNAAVPTLNGRTNLQAQVNNTTLYNGADTYEYRKSSSNTVDYNTKLGWYMDMGSEISSDKGEKIVYSPKILPNGIVTFSSLVPAGGVCAFGGYSWNYFVDALTGSSLNNSPFDTNGLPTGISSRKSKNGIVTPSTLLYIGNGIAYAPQSGTSGGLEVTKLNLSGGKNGRVSWREINK